MSEIEQARKRAQFGERARELVTVSERDILSLRCVRDIPDFADVHFGNITQQAVEKLFKAWINLIGEPYPYSHDLGALWRMLSDGGADVARFKRLALYTPYAGNLRYESSGQKDGPIDRPKAIKQVEELHDEVVRRLEEAEVD